MGFTDLVTSLLESADDFTDESSLDTVRLCRNANVSGFLPHSQGH